MASVSCDSSGRRRIQFTGADRRRYTLRLGEVSAKQANTVRGHVEEIVRAQVTTTTPAESTNWWLSQCDEVMIDKLASVNLAAKRTSATLGAFIDDYIQSRSDVKSGTTTMYGHTKRCLIEYFGSGKALRDVSAGDADLWRLWLFSHEHLSENTARRRIKLARQFFRAAARRKLITDNPFDGIPTTVRENLKRMVFVTRDDIQKVLDACPNPEWRLIFALARYGGLRCPSEILALRWGDVDWEHNRITVHSPKTEHHAGKDQRIIPLFPELLPHLQECFDHAVEGAQFIITGYRDAKQNLRTQAERIIKRAGVLPWVKMFQNLRSTRETELAESFPLHVVCAWLGNSQPVAMKHYLQVTDDHFGQAIRCEKKVTPNPTLQASVSDTKPLAIRKQDKLYHDDLHTDADNCERVQSREVGLQGFEPRTKRL